MIEGIKNYSCDHYLNDFWGNRMAVNQCKITVDVPEKSSNSSHSIDLLRLDNDIDKIISEHQQIMKDHIDNKVIKNVIVHEPKMDNKICYEPKTDKKKYMKPDLFKKK